MLENFIQTKCFSLSFKLVMRNTLSVKIQILFPKTPNAQYITRFSA
jgi:hypothetical protein